MDWSRLTYFLHLTFSSPSNYRQTFLFLLILVQTSNISLSLSLLFLSHTQTHKKTHTHIRTHFSFCWHNDYLIDPGLIRSLLNMQFGPFKKRASNEERKTNANLWTTQFKLVGISIVTLELCFNITKLLVWYRTLFYDYLIF